MLTREADVSPAEVEVLADDRHEGSRGKGGKEAHHEVEPGQVEGHHMRLAKGENLRERRNRSCRALKVQSLEWEGWNGLP